jgi:hypothetical protein
MAIVIYCTESNGYGDLLFGLKLAEGLRTQLKKKQYNDDVYLVTKKESIEKIMGIGGDIEFGVSMTTPEKFNELLNQNKIQVDYLISGPAFKPNTNQNMNGMNECKKLPSDINIMLCLEYALPNGSMLRTLADKEAEIYANRNANLRDYKQSQDIAEKLRQKIEIRDSGFGSNQMGILISDKILEASLSKDISPIQHNQHLREAWDILDGVKKLHPIRDNKQPDNYNQSTNFTFEYSSQSTNNSYSANSCEHFLKVQAAYAKNEPKNQDVLSVGLEKGLKYQALENCKKQLIANGYTHIEFIDLEDSNPKPTIVHHEAREPEKIYRMLYAKTLPHIAMEALQIVSGPVVGFNW